MCGVGKLSLLDLDFICVIIKIYIYRVYPISYYYNQINSKSSYTIGGLW